MRSVRTCALTLPLAVLLTGCVSTQRIAARQRLVNARVLAEANPTQVTNRDPAVSVGRPAVIRARGGVAVVVPLRNQSASALTDLPISVGISTRSGRKLYLNQSTNLDYFETHVAAIRPRSAISWVFIANRNVPVKTTPFATVGFPQFHAQVSGGLPQIDVSSRGAARLALINRSAVPQYDLQVYVVAVRAGHAVAAGRAAVAHLGSLGRTTVRVTLLGNPTQAALRLIAVPTIFS